MSGFCPADCQEITLIDTDPGCIQELRERRIERVGYSTCDVDIPNPLTEEAVQEMITAGKLAISNKIAVPTWEDPNYQEIELNDCDAPLSKATSRVMTFQDRIRSDKPASLSPVEDPIPFFNYDFWNDKRKYSASLIPWFFYCEGSVEIARDEQGNTVTADIRVFKNIAREGTGLDRVFYEYISVRMAFATDPINLGNKPELDADGNVINVSGWNIF